MQKPLATPRSPVPLVIAGVGLVAFSALIWLAVAVSDNATQAFDLTIRDGIHQYASPAATAVAKAVTTLGSILFLSLAFAMSLIGLLLARLRQEAARLSCLMVGAFGLENGLKFGIHRIRPDAFFGVEPTTYSFPSGHSLLSFCFYFAAATAIARRTPGNFTRIIVWAAAVALVACIGLSRVYLGVHYPTDVIGGFVTAMFWIAVVVAGQSLLVPAPDYRWR